MCVFFLQQKTAYELRISDGSSDVCSSDLTTGPLDPVKVWDLVSSERPNMLTIVGDAVAKPLLDVWDAAEPGRWDATSLFAISNGGAPLSAGGKARNRERFPDVLATAGFGPPAAGNQGPNRKCAVKGQRVDR